jgi:hypothetical protein
MMKQARSTQPTVLPLTAPRFAPAAASPLENFNETEIRAVEDSPRRKRQRQSAPENINLESAATLATRELEKPRTPFESSNEATKAQEFRVPSRPDKVQDGVADGIRQPSERALMETRAFPAKAARIEAFDDASLDSETTGKNTQTRNDDEAESSSRANLERPSNTKLTAPERAELAMEVRSSRDRDSGPQAESHEVPAEQRTEIHISIGSIELRAPHVESRPQVVPFRPRVSLDDFLGRKPGGAA